MPLLFQHTSDMEMRQWQCKQLGNNTTITSAWTLKEKWRSKKKMLMEEVCNADTPTILSLSKRETMQVKRRRKEKCASIPQTLRAVTKCVDFRGAASRTMLSRKHFFHITEFAYFSRVRSLYNIEDAPNDS